VDHFVLLLMQHLQQTHQERVKKARPCSSVIWIDCGSTKTNTTWTFRSI